MPTQISLTTELSRERLLELRDEIDALLGAAQPGMPAPVAVGQPATSDALDGVALSLRARLSGNLERFARDLVTRYGDREFTWDDVARDTGRGVPTLKSWHRSLSKPMNRLSAEYPSVPLLVKSARWDGNRNHYVIGAGWKAAIERTWT